MTFPWKHSIFPLVTPWDNQGVFKVELSHALEVAKAVVEQNPVQREEKQQKRAEERRQREEEIKARQQQGEQERRWLRMSPRDQWVMAVLLGLGALYLFGLKALYLYILAFLIYLICRSSR